MTWWTKASGDAYWSVSLTGRYPRVVTGVRMSRRPEGLPLGEYDAALLARLTGRLTTTLTGTLHQSPSVAAALASQVRWTVERDENGLWMTMTFPDGTYSAVGGEWPQEPE